MKILLRRLLLAGLAGVWATCNGADVVPNEIMMPGTQPNEVGNFESPDKCDNCHAGYNLDDPGAEPATGWRGAAMGNAGRDPVFWATLAVVEQDFDGAGDLCIRCHSAGGWYGGRSTPTDGSGLATSDDDGIDCDTCHASTNTDESEIIGQMDPPFISNCSPDPNVPDKCSKVGNSANSEGFYGSGMLSLKSDTNVKLGPYTDADARHQWQHSRWHRHPDFCGTCHDVSNSAVGDLAGNHGTQSLLPDNAGVVSSHDNPTCNGTRLPNGGCLGGDIEDKAAFNNPPYAYGIVERTFSEYKSSPLSSTLVSDFVNLPDGSNGQPNLQVEGGSLQVTYEAALQAGTGGDYADGTPRYFSCQSCHMRPTVGAGCDKNGVQIRPDLPRHDHTGGNYWFAAMAQHQDTAGTLRLGGGLNSTQLLAMDLGAERATKHLREAASLSVTGNTIRVTNLTGHKLITGYPEGRRMWLNIKWYDDQGNKISEDGEYGSLPTSIDLDGDGEADSVETILDLDGANTEIYEAEYTITKEWAGIVKALHGPGFALSYDRTTGLPDCTVEVFLQNDPDTYPDCSGDYHKTFHFALNNYVAEDNRIPPYQMSYTEAQKRNALPVPETRYPRTGDTYVHYDDVQLVPPGGATYATIDLLYQGTSWEYMLFLQMANDGSNAFLGNQGDAMMDAWLNKDVIKSTGEPITSVMEVGGDYKMVPPVIMASVAWGAPPVCTPTPGQEQQETSCQDGVDNDCDGFTDAADSDCPQACVPTELGTELTCDDGLDNDCDDLVDCDDSDCDADPACQTGMACSEYVDKGACNNDPNCEWVGSPKSGFCQDATGGTAEICDDGIDNDGDTLVDCDDGDCSGDPACQTGACDNDGVCEAGEDCNSCISDCAGQTGGKPANRFCCGNGIAEAAEGDGTICDGNY